jgi:acyl carrier protein phosphodiesterase
MNFLAHLHLSGDDPDVITGNMMGDFVKGRLEGRFPPRITLGLNLHRRIDSFAGSHPAFQASRQRIDPRFGLYRAVLVDLFYDHFLAAHWERFSAEPLADFIVRSEAVVRSRAAHLPERLEQVVPAIFGEWIPSYADPDGIGRVLVRMAARIGRANPLADGARELLRGYDGLRDDFFRFYPDIMINAQLFVRGENPE